MERPITPIGSARVFAPNDGDGSTRDFSQSGDPGLTPAPCVALSNRLGQIANPTVASHPSGAAIPDRSGA